MKKIKSLIKERKKFLAENSIEDWNEMDTIFVAEEYAKYVLKKTNPNRNIDNHLYGRYIKTTMRGNQSTPKHKK